METEYYNGLIERKIERMSPIHRRDAQRYKQLRLEVDNLTLLTVVSDTSLLLLLSKFLKDKPFAEVTRDDIEDFVRELKNEMTPKTYNCYVVILKNFYKFIRHPDICRKGSQYRNDVKTPPEVDWIKLHKISTKVKTKQVLTVEHIKKMKTVCDGIRSKTLLEVMFETGARAGEICDLRVEDVNTRSVDEGVIYIPTSKGKSETERRPVNIRRCVPYLTAYLNQHPFREYKLCPLFYSHDPKTYPSMLSKKSNGTLTDDDLIKLRIRENSLYRIVNTIGKRAEIPFKVNCHLFRHSSVTFMQKKNFNEALLRLRYGWRPDSKMPSHYTHISNGDDPSKYAEIFGVEIPEKPVETVIKICPSCNAPNVPDNIYCCECNMVLDYKELERMKKDEEEKQRKLVRDETAEIRKELELLKKILLKEKIMYIG